VVTTKGNPRRLLRTEHLRWLALWSSAGTQPGCCKNCWQFRGCGEDKDQLQRENTSAI